MSEEVKDIILDVKDSLNEIPKNMYKYNKVILNLNEFEEILNYIEQLENTRKEKNKIPEKLKDVIKDGCIEAVDNFKLMDKINEILDYLKDKEE